MATPLHQYLSPDAIEARDALYRAVDKQREATEGKMWELLEEQGKHGIAGKICAPTRVNNQ